MSIVPIYDSMSVEDDALRDEAFRQGWVGSRDHHNPDDTPGLLSKVQRQKEDERHGN